MRRIAILDRLFHRNNNPEHIGDQGEDSPQIRLWRAKMRARIETRAWQYFNRQMWEGRVPNLYDLLLQMRQEWQRSMGVAGAQAVYSRFRPRLAKAVGGYWPDELEGL